MRYGPSTLLLGRDEILRDKHQMGLQIRLCHKPVRRTHGPEVLEGSITHL